MLAGGAVCIKPPGGIRPVMLLSNLTGQKTIMWELKVPASNNSTCLCVVGAFEWWSCWRGFAVTPSHHRAWQENRLHSCSKISRSYGSLKLQRRKISCATNNNHRMVEYSRVTRRKKWRQNTDAHNVLTLLFQPCVDGNGESPVWSRPGVWKAKLSLWRGSAEDFSSWIQEKIHLSFCRLEKCWMGRTEPWNNSLRKAAWQCGE